MLKAGLQSDVIAYGTLADVFGRAGQRKQARRFASDAYVAPIFVLYATLKLRSFEKAVP